jgi:dimeric dUTPase (all-alpha-NTP-PPase superfamily)
MNQTENFNSNLFDTILLIKEEQKFLDNLIHSKKSLSLSETFYLRKLALLVEIGEFSNELESFKF